MAGYSWGGHSGMNRSPLYRQSKKGYQPEGPWWQKALATVIACVVIILIFAVIFFIGSL